MEKSRLPQSSSLFVNDGSFMERFKQMQKEKEEKERAAAAAAVAVAAASIAAPSHGSGSRGEGSPTSSRPSPDDAEGGGCAFLSSCTSAADSGPSSSRTAPTSKAGAGGSGSIAFSLGRGGGGAGRAGAGGTNGKLAFSLKTKPKPAIKPIRLGGDDEDEDENKSMTRSDDKRDAKRPRTDAGGSSSTIGASSSSSAGGAPPPPPSDPDVQRVADKLASFVAKTGRQFENITRQKNPGDTPFRFLFDTSCADYKYYEWKLAQEEAALGVDSQRAGSSSGAAGSHRPPPKEGQSVPTRYQTPASALYTSDDLSSRPSKFHDAMPVPSSTAPASAGASAGQSAGEVDSVTMMEYFMKKAARQDLRKPSKSNESSQNRTGAASGAAGRGHHMGDFIPEEELQKFLARCNDVKAQAKALEAAESAKIQSDNVGHKLLSKMGWKEGMGLGSSGGGRADPVEAGSVKLNNLGVGAQHPGEVTPEDDIYEQYKKRMMLGYRYRPNPLNNPRKAYY
ncbi:hypothetical protein CBR_g19876 [Chara braunii]|uniref:G-patch domain-containing protein n=1 Tax=Chara braunii TaxID=69332 RepID=A0A388KYV3_CHABU|nr:hypothetical protein CBR_g19876 [Chara braunii]|eukprot:GBG75240.1 hypothetical protein CBR_g19876 [Chara braunii]